MTRLFRFLLRNWPLKLAAVLLATLLYSGLVLSQNVRTFSGPVPVEILSPPPGAVLLADIEPLREVRFRAPFDVGIVSPDWFRATVSLANVTPRPGGEPQEVAVSVRPVDSRVTVVDYEPRTVQVRLDTIEERELEVLPVPGPVPEGITIGTPQTDPSRVVLRGPSSRVTAVQRVVARVTIDASALNIDREVALEALDDQGNLVPGLEISPARARVRITVAEELASRSLPVVPQLVGDLPTGYRLASVAAQPLSVTVEGPEALVSHLEMAQTAAIDMSNRTRDFEISVSLDLPSEVQPVGVTQVTVSVAISEEMGSRTFMAGFNLVGTNSQMVYRPALTQLSVTLGGPLSTLDALDASSLVGQIQVTDLEPGLHQLPVTLTPPSGLELLSIQPGEVLVRVESAADEGRSGAALAAVAALRL